MLQQGVIGLSLAVGLVCGGPAFAQSAPSPLAMTTENLSAHFDAQVPGAMSKAGVAGSAIVVVKDGKVLFARGYGYADVEHKTPVSPSETLFRVGSISKVVAYTAVMQLVEQGRIDLDADVARYVDFPIPATFADPITMRHLMSHTAGFEDTLKGRWVSSGQRTSSRDYLVQAMPRRLFAPGTVPAYSSFGTTLAAYIVERVSGEPFETYAQRYIFSPLGMQHSSFAQPLPPRLAPMLAQAYETISGPAKAFDTAQIAAAAGMSSSALDMARFMLVHLGASAPSEPLRLMPATLAQMHAVQFRHHPAGPGIALGLFEMDEVAPRLIGHTGNIPGFYSGMYLWPAQRLGFFIVQNTETGPAMRNALLKSFAGRYLPSQAQAAAMPRRMVADQSGQVQGSYRSTWRFESSPLYLNVLLNQSVVRRVAPRTLVIDTQVGLQGRPVEWRQVDEGVWQSAENPHRRLYFRKNAQGDWEMSSNRSPEQVWQKGSWHQHKLVILFVLLGSIAVIVPTLLAWPVTALLRRRAGPRTALSPPIRTARTAMRLAILLALSPWVLYASIGLIVAHELLFVASPAFPILLRAVQALAWLAVAGAIHAALSSWRTPALGWVSRSHHVLLLLACSGAAAMAWQGGLLMWNGQF